MKVLGLLLAVTLFGIVCADNEINFNFNGILSGVSAGGDNSGDNGGNGDDNGPSAEETDCSFVDHDDLVTKLSQVVCGEDTCEAVHDGNGNAGLGFNMWATVVNRYGRVCAVAYTAELGDQWPGSRVISAQKANTANLFSLNNFPLSTANLYSTVQPGGTLFGLQHSNPVDPAVAYAGNTLDYGTSCTEDVYDPMCGQKVGGVNVFGGGLALYDEDGIVGAVGVSGDTSCTDHVVAWRLRDALGLDYVPGGVTDGTDNINFEDGAAFSHPSCGDDVVDIANNLPTNYPYSTASP